MVKNQISTVLKQALTTFASKKEKFQANLDDLKSLLDKITASDVNLNPQFMTDALWKSQNKAPVTYINIYEDDIISMGIFILKPGMKLPLHDHPQMYGLIKIISGTARIRSFSIQDNLQEKFGFPLVLTAECSSDLVANSASECCVLEPEKRNLHEIESVGGPAAFLDILSPPYDTVIPNLGPRKCSYFQIINQLAPKLFMLQEIDSPQWFWSDSHPYCGPDIFQ